MTAAVGALGHDLTAVAGWFEPFQAATPFFQGGVKAHFPWFSMYCLIVSIGAPPHEMAQ
jgi:hypothetical protein